MRFPHDPERMPDLLSAARPVTGSSASGVSLTGVLDDARASAGELERVGAQLAAVTEQLKAVRALIPRAGRGSGH